MGIADPLPFDRQRDLAAIVRLVARCRAEGSGYMHPGGLQWWLRRVGRERFAVNVWWADSQLVAFVMEDDGYVFLQTADRAARAEILTWCEKALRAAGRPSIEVSTRETDADGIAALRGRGYARIESHSEELTRDLGDEPPAPVLPDGFTMASLATVGDDAHVRLHREAWSTVAPSPYDGAQHAAVTAMPDFRHDMVPIVLAPDGAPAAYCIGWLDRVSRTVEIEPLATHPSYRRLGLATAVVHEVARRARAHGARTVLVWGSHGNDAAARMYRMAGMSPSGIVREFRKQLQRAGRQTSDR